MGGRVVLVTGGCHRMLTGSLLLPSTRNRLTRIEAVIREVGLDSDTVVMAEARFRIVEDLRGLGREEEASAHARSPVGFLHWMLARVLVGESIDIGESQLRTFQQGFPPAERDFPNLRRHVCVAASALLAGRPVGASPA
ncbi:MAG: hypothetical protein K0S65_474, partial [Labilithrix sp.]|nr:hypothetical protein [Labilithrix sp.]